MGGSSITFEIKDAAVRANLQAMINRLDNPTPLMKIFGAVIVRSVQKNFEAGGRPNAWIPSQRVLTGLVKKSHGEMGAGGGKTLIVQGWAGGLLGSIHSNASRDEVKIGTPKIYGAVHQFGWAERNIPARPFLVIQDEDWDTIIRKTETWMTKAGYLTEGGN
jgi:phage virion morphogenesis protein